MKTAENRIEEIKREGYSLDFGQVFEYAFDVYKKIAVSAGLAIIIFGFIAFALIMGVAIAYFGAASLSKQMIGFDPGEFSLSMKIYYTLVVTVFSGIAAPFTAGILSMAHLAGTGQPFSLSTAFSCYKAPYFGRIFFATAIISLVNVGLSLVLESFGIEFVGGVIGYLVGIFTVLTVPLVIFGNLMPFEAITGSFTLVGKQFIWIFLLVLCGAILSILGIFGFCLGIFFTLPLVYAIQYSIYANSVGVDEPVDALDEIGRPEF